MSLPVYGLVTIDVEPDDVWRNTQSRSLYNVDQLRRFHRLCLSYGVRPTYLVSYSVADDREARTTLEELSADGTCEIGAHPHLWETPPRSRSDFSSLATVAACYSLDTLAAKVAALTTMLREHFGTVTSHRAGRWGLTGHYLPVLEELGLLVDSSVTPGLDWSATGAPDYRGAPLRPYRLGGEGITNPGTSSVIEVPCTVRPCRSLAGIDDTRLGRGALSRLGLGAKWLRCAPHTKEGQIISLCEWASNTVGHLNLMTHSSELAPGASPYWTTHDDVERHFRLLETIFRWWLNNDVRPATLSEYARIWIAGQARGAGR